MSVTFKIVDNDILVSAVTGRPATVADGDALKQAILCNLETNTRDNGFGAGLQTLVGTDTTDPDVMSMILDRKIRSSFQTMVNLQGLPPTGQRPASERLSGVGIIQATQDPTDPRAYRYSVSLTTQAGAALRVAGVLSQE
jgi:hypothetical protein